MGKKKNLKGLDEFEIEFIENKMKGDSALNYLTSCGMVTQLKALSFKLDIKCKNEKQKEFLNVLKNKKNQICFGIDTVPKGRFHDFVFCQFFFGQQGKARVVVFDFVDGEFEVVGEVLRGGLRRT